jgi:dihydropteroate synthase
MQYSYTLKSKGRLLVLDTPVAMGIINATPDSFFEKSRSASIAAAVEQAGQMLDAGAVLLDIGGQSTRPGATLMPASEELDRVLPIIEELRKTFPSAWLSLDTFYAEVASKGLQAGADIINDVSAGDVDGKMLETVAAAQVPYIAMHKQGMPADMQSAPYYENVTEDIIGYFLLKKAELEKLGIYDWILDPGFGFGKNLDHNYAIMKNLSSFQLFKRPILVGISRKGMVQKALDVNAYNALNGSTALHMYALQKGAAILRVHDVKEAVECLKLWQLLQ